MTSLIIFGAGASFGSDSIGTPPLGGGLFPELVSFDPRGWGGLPETLKERFSSDFEEGMRRLSEEYPHSMSRLQRAMAAYFFAFAPRPTNLYFSVVKWMIDNGWSGTVATLNYERLFQMCIIQSGLRPIVGKPDSPKEIELCFPHGCCNLFCESIRGLSGAVSFMGNAVSTNGPVVPIDDPRTYKARIESDAFPPVMSYFDPKKGTTSGASFIADQRERYRECVSRATTVAIIGVKVRMNDEHLWKPLAETDARLLYCGGLSGGREFGLWTEAYRRDRSDVVFDGNFDEKLEGLLKELEGS